MEYSVQKKKLIREQDPLKQGLKHLKGPVIPWIFRNSRARSTKTRIETIFSECNVDSITIREQDPLKQGLKPQWHSSIVPSLTNSRARSTKTRIETR